VEINPSRLLVLSAPHFTSLKNMFEVEKPHGNMEKSQAT
jgi:hypothetical protein